MNQYVGPLVRKSKLSGDPTMLGSRERTWIEDLLLFVTATVVANYVLDALRGSNRR